jgi:predicted CXXCH cytochrome family protein
VSKLPFLLDMMQMMGYDAVTPGEREFGYGYRHFVNLVRQRKLNVVLANLTDKASGKALWKPYIVVKKQGAKVAIGGLIGKTIPMGPAQDSVVVQDPLVVAQKLVPEMRKKADVVVLLAHMGRVDAEDLASQIPGIDVLVIGHHPGLVLTSRKINQTISVAGGEQGQDMGVSYVDIEGKVATPREGKVVVLTPEVGERADIAKLQKIFTDSLEAQARRTAQAEAAKSSTNRPGQPHFLGRESCVSCHQAQYEQWKTTPHAKAFATLVDAHKESTAECVSCHVTGFQKPGGFQSAATTAAMANVQCESCHGMGSEHNMSASQISAPTESLCVGCHTAAQDSTWNYAVKLAKIRH